MREVRPLHSQSSKFDVPSNNVNFPTTIDSLYHFHHDKRPYGFTNKDDYEAFRKKASFKMNAGKAYDTLRRDLPLVFATSSSGMELDFSIFADNVAVVDGSKYVYGGRDRRIEMTKSIYIAAVKSLRFAAGFSSTIPSLNIKKIEYVEDSKTIQCCVNIVLPDALKFHGDVSICTIIYLSFINLISLCLPILIIILVYMGRNVLF